MTISDKEHHDFCKSISDQIMNKKGLETWQFGALISTTICWWLRHRVPGTVDRLEFLTKLAAGISRRIDEGIGAEKEMRQHERIRTRH